MARTKKVTITLPVELLESMKTHTDNVSGYLSARRSAGQLKVAGLHGHKYAVDAMVAETPDVDGMVKLCGRRVRTIGL